MSLNGFAFSFSLISYSPGMQPNPLNNSGNLFFISAWLFGDMTSSTFLMISNLKDAFRAKSYRSKPSNTNIFLCCNWARNLPLHLSS